MKEKVLIEAYKDTMGFFRDKIKKILSDKKLNIDEATEFYVVNLLTSLSHVPSASSQCDHRQALALILAKASDAQNLQEKFLGFKTLGDQALFISGFFSDSLKEKIVDVDYYMTMGIHAYQVLSGLSTHRQFSSVFLEMAMKFHFLVDALAELSEECQMTSNEDLLRVYDRWSTTKSERLLQILRDGGLDPLQIKKEKKFH
ncbi:MAG: hypothetical protein R3A45_02180 [Bdellovibrionota bacterium]